MLVLKILFMSLCLGVASKALLMSIAMSSVLLCGALMWLKPSSVSFVICVDVSNVLVECFGLKTC